MKSIRKVDLWKKSWNAYVPGTAVLLSTDSPRSQAARLIFGSWKVLNDIFYRKIGHMTVSKPCQKVIMAVRSLYLFSNDFDGQKLMGWIGLIIFQYKSRIFKNIVLMRYL